MLLFWPFLAYSNKHNSLHLSILHVLQISANISKSKWTIKILDANSTLISLQCILRPSHTTLLYILFKTRNFTRQHNFAVYCLKMSLTPQNISGKARHCEPSEFESHMIIMDSWLRADSNLIETHSDSFHLYDRSEVLWQTLSIKNLAVPHVKLSHKNKPCWVL